MCVCVCVCVCWRVALSRSYCRYSAYRCVALRQWCVFIAADGVVSMAAVTFSVRAPTTNPFLTNSKKIRRSTDTTETRSTLVPFRGYRRRLPEPSRTGANDYSLILEDTSYCSFPTASKPCYFHDTPKTSYYQGIALPTMWSKPPPHMGIYTWV